MVRFLINTPDEIHDFLKKAAKEQGQSLNALVRQILWDWVKQNSKEVAGRKWKHTDRTEKQCNLFPDN